MWLRLILTVILIYLIVSAIGRYLSGGRNKDDKTSVKGNNNSKKGFPEDMGEYVDYEEVDDD